MKRTFYYQDDLSNKFWTIEAKGTAYVASNGRVGAKARETVRTFASIDEANTEISKQIASKLKKGYVEGEPPEYTQPNWAEMTMTEDLFWRIIALFNWKKTGDDEAVMWPAVRALSSMSVDDIARFADIMTEKLFALDTEAHARHIGDHAYGKAGYFSVDWFLYVRCVVVANGQEYYNSVLAAPEEMPEDIEFEALLELAALAYEHKINEEFEHLSPLSYETFSNSAAWPSDDES
ncbi:DUF4240 domain-containing protein [Glaciecola sp. MH2013]|uniref:DUF4240 domain-containing protein n=1 Tax=Glaciecola sp. MH2013 TaxID=2785524 RepID=UPI00189CBFF9|nr:DUF4240 domain-containing protein [Glaciecola sp. MH2013]MBF7074281.1 DUF4240 domain-containing protein [Glaciecola sp. MH2013]